MCNKFKKKKNLKRSTPKNKAETKFHKSLKKLVKNQKATKIRGQNKSNQKFKICNLKNFSKKKLVIGNNF